MNLLTNTEKTTPSSLLILRAPKRWTEWMILKCLGSAAFVTLVTSVAIIGVLVYESSAFFSEVSFADFFGGIEWQPLFSPQKFGIWPLFSGTLLVAGVASCVAFPLGLGAAIYLSEYAHPKFRSIVKPALEVLAGIPSVVFGYFALVTITPFITRFFPEVDVFNALSAGFVVGLMTLPLVASVSDDCLAAVPQSMKNGAYALGARKSEVIRSVALPAASSGIVASFILAFSRAVGETMAVTLAAGSTPNFTADPLVSIQTMTAYIVQVSMGDTPHGTIEYQSIFAVGLSLFVMTMAANILASRIVKRLRRQVSGL